jgi:hypothetical protein
MRGWTKTWSAHLTRNRWELSCVVKPVPVVGDIAYGSHLATDIHMGKTPP